MTKHPWAGQKWGSRTGEGLCAVVTLVLVLACAGPLYAMHPVRPSSDARLHRVASRRVVREEATTHRASRSSRAEAKHVVSKPAPKSSRSKAKAPVKPQAPSRTRGRKSHRQAEPDVDPPLMHRTTHSRRPEPGMPLSEYARHTVVVRELHPSAKAPARELAPPPVTEAQLAPDQSLPVASSNVEADIKEFPTTASAGRARGGKQPFLPEDHAARQTVIAEAIQPVVLPTMYTRRGRLIVPPPLKGSHDILVHQNTMADTEGLDRIQDDDALEHMQELHLLVPLRDTGSLIVNDGLPENRRYARPWAARFATDLGRAYYARFHQPLHLNSAVRTVEYQLRLQRTNGNAAAVDGDGASPHLTGQAIDFGKRGMSLAQIAWMRAYLGVLMRAGKIDVEEEFQQACFHVSIYKSYLPAPKAKTSMEVAEKRVPAAQP